MTSLVQDCKNLETQDLVYIEKAISETSIIARTDTKGRITYVNDLFVEISGYSRDELIGKSHHIINSGVHDSEFFKKMWQDINAGKLWRGEICNRAKDGHLYWVDSIIFPFECYYSLGTLFYQFSMFDPSHSMVWEFGVSSL